MSLLSRYRLRKLVKQWRHPATLLRYAGLRAAYALRHRTVPFRPIHFDIEPANACNLKCPHCQVTHWNRKAIRLTRAKFESLLDDLGPLISVKLQGMGEPFLNGELVEMLLAGEARGISMRVVTNGTLCDPDTVEGLLALRDTDITFSLDGATRVVFEAIRPGSDFELVCGNISTLVRRREGRKRPRVRAATLITRQNAHEVLDIVALAGRLGVDGITLRPTVGNWGRDSMRPHTDPLAVPRAELAQILRAARALAGEHGVSLSIYRPSFLRGRAVCNWPWISAFIASNGDVVPCCRVSDPDTVRMGNVFEESFTRIWNSAPYHDLRRRLRSHDLPGFCANCRAAADPVEDQVRRQQQLP